MLRERLRVATVAPRIGVVGTGYVGLTTAICLAHLGHTVRAGDSDADKVAMLASGRPTIVEDGLEDMLRSEIASGRLSFVFGAEEAARSAEFVFLCVPTPQLSDGSADTSMLEAAVAEISAVLEHDAIVVNKSTVPVGSTLVVERMLQEKRHRGGLEPRVPERGECHQRRPQP